MRRLVFGLLLLAGCAHARAVELAPDVSLTPLASADGVEVWEHVTVARGIPANGLVVISGGSAVLVDSGWTPAQAELLWAWSTARGTPIRDVIVTHFHADRSGGREALRAHGVKVHELADTARRLRDTDVEVFDVETQVGPLQLFFPGAGHAPDNIVVWEPHTRVLDGGCFVKAASADIGNLSDAVVAAWPASLAAVRARFPDAKVVVPGHGELGGLELLTHTEELARASAVRP